MRPWFAFVVALSSALAAAATNAQVETHPAGDGPAPQATQRDLSAAFHTRSPWRLVVTEGPRVKDYGDNEAPGALTLCLRKAAAGPCVAEPVTPPPRDATPGDGPAWEPHYLLAAQIVHPRGPQAPPFLLLVTGSLYSGNGDQLVTTQLIRYDAGRDEFKRLYAKGTGHNNNQEIRFVADGPLRGSIITAEPQDRRPFGYWITVEKLQPDDTYRQVLRFASATRYGDGNPLAVIDSEMPTIQRRLGFWKPGQPLPVPSGKACAKPALRHGALWCD